MEIILAAALLPAIILMVYVYKHDKIEKEPFVLLLTLFALARFPVCRPVFWRICSPRFSTL